ncbi:MAG: hypothetical protein H7Z37_04545, partial [Pyrinomonadaceae bacterium]|nr:hypothetical protein [Pyrinomonadaceae bacterium]
MSDTVKSNIAPSLALKNHLLVTLHSDDFARVQPFLEPLSFKLGAVLYE